MKYLTEAELNAVKGLVHYLNESLTTGGDFAIDATITDANGENVGKVAITDSGEYGLVFP